MTEADWLAGTGPKPMLDFLEGKVSDRKLRLFACACARRVFHLMADEQSKNAVEVAEAYADGRATEEVRRLAEERAETIRAAAQEKYDNSVDESTYAASDEVIGSAYALWVTASAAAAARATLLSAGEGAAQDATQAGWEAVEWDDQARHWFAGEGRTSEGFTYRDAPVQAALLRCVVGDPFRPAPVVLPAWLAWNDGTVQRLATAIYDERAFERLPILADALEEAGCTDRGLLDHLRSPGPHVRACWGLDLVLGRE